jgi:hypothetical protein
MPRLPLFNAASHNGPQLLPHGVHTSVPRVSPNWNFDEGGLKAYPKKRPNNELLRDVPFSGAFLHPRLSDSLLHSFPLFSLSTVALPPPPEDVKQQSRFK